MSLFRALFAELLKLKRTLALRVALLLPLLVAVLEFFIILKTKTPPPASTFWKTLVTNSLEIWGVFMMPLLITLETALLNGIEHADKQWKHILVLPVARHSIYLAKVIVAQALILLSTFILAALTVIVGVTGSHIRSELASVGSTPYLWIVKLTIFVWLASWFIIAIHTWISIRWSGFPIPLGAGIGGTFFALFAASASLGKFYPWLLPMNIFIEGRLRTALVLGMAGGVVSVIAGCLEFVRRDVA